MDDGGGFGGEAGQERSAADFLKRLVILEIGAKGNGCRALIPLDQLERGVIDLAQNRLVEMFRKQKTHDPAGRLVIHENRADELGFRVEIVGRRAIAYAVYLVAPDGDDRRRCLSLFHGLGIAPYDIPTTWLISVE